MKVLQVIPSIAAVHGGPSRAIRLIEQALCMQGMVVDTATTNDSGPEDATGNKIDEPVFMDGITRYYFAKRINFYKVAPGFLPWIVRHAHEYDLIHIHALFSFTSTVAAWVARLAKVAYVVRPLGTLSRYGVEQRRPWLKRLSLKFIEGPILRHAAAVHFTAEAEKTEAELLGIPINGVVIPLGVASQPLGDAAMFLSRHPKLYDRRLLLFLSRLDPKKNVEGLLEGFSQCVKRIPDIHLVIAGNGESEYVDSLKKFSDKLGISEQVTWAGYVEGDYKQDLLAAASVFVLPSFSENFGIAAVEALMVGLPCILGEGVAIATDLEQVEAGLVTEPEPEAIAAAIHRLFENDQQLARMGRNAQVLAKERYSLEKMGTNLRELYESIPHAEAMDTA